MKLAHIFIGFILSLLLLYYYYYNSLQVTVYVFSTKVERRKYKNVKGPIGHNLLITDWMCYTWKKKKKNLSNDSKKLNVTKHYCTKMKIFTLHHF